MGPVLVPSKTLRFEALGFGEELGIEMGRLGKQQDRCVGGDAVSFEMELADGAAGYDLQWAVLSKRFLEEGIRER